MWRCWPPCLGFYTSQVLHSLLIPRLSGVPARFGILLPAIAGSASFSFLWSAVYLLTLTALCARLFLWRLRKEAGGMKLLRSCKLNLLQWRINPKYLAIFLYMALYLCM